MKNSNDTFLKSFILYENGYKSKKFKINQALFMIKSFKYLCSDGNIGDNILCEKFKNGIAPKLFGEMKDNNSSMVKAMRQLKINHVLYIIYSTHYLTCNFS